MDNLLPKKYSCISSVKNGELKGDIQTEEDIFILMPPLENFTVEATVIIKEGKII